MDAIRNNCLLCDGEVIFTSSDMAVDIYPDIEDEDAILHYAKYNKCGAEYEIVQYAETQGDDAVRAELKLRKEMLS